MRYGLFYLPSSLPSSRADGAMRLRTIVEQTCYGEQLGFDSVWLAEHHFHSFGGLFSATPVIGAAIAQQTSTIRIGTAVILLPYHNPLRVAEDYATLDCLSSGRLEFGVGHGFVKWEALTFGIPLEELRERFRENLEVVLKAWTQPTVDYRGNFYQFHGVEIWPRPVQEPHPTVWMAATTSVESFELSGRYGFHMMLIPFLNEVEELRGKMKIYFDARRAAGHDP
jgi:alkanesulfonate monooxygenase SsuD/methylene tetrahydromethanopterin reductase-like flavin-dependent oxidoreductase (luciferase family)